MDAIEFSQLRIDIVPGSSYESLLEQCNARLAAALSQGSPVGAAHAYVGRAECQRRLGKRADAQDDLQRGVELFTAAQDAAGVRLATWGLGNLQRGNSDFEAATRSLRAVIDSARQDGDRRMYAYATAGTAEIARLQGDYRSAWPAHAAATRAYLAIDDRRGVVWGIEGFAQMLRNSGNPGRAAVLFSRADKISSTIGDIRARGWARKGHAECLALTGDTREARRVFALALADFQRVTFGIGIAYTLKSRGDAEVGAGRYAQAFDDYSAALEIFRRHKDARGEAYTQVGVGALFRRSGLPDAAHELFRKSEATFVRLRVRRGVQLSQKGLSRLDGAPKSTSATSTKP